METNETVPSGDAAVPVTGHPAMDAALAGLSLDPDVHTHPEDIAAVLEVVQQALNPPPSATPPP